MIIRQLFVSPSTAAKVTSGKRNTRKKVCIHETGNKTKGSRADNHARLQANGNSRSASWHWTVDDKEAVQSFAHNYQCWAAGTTKGNNEAIHIEMCVNSDGDYKKTVQNTAELVAKILKEEGLTVNDVVQHNFYSGKNCPERMRSTSAPVPWSSFLQMIKANMQPSTPTTVKDKPTENVLNARKLIQQAVKEGVFTGEHKELNNYTTDQLLKYALVYIERKIK